MRPPHDDLKAVGQEKYQLSLVADLAAAAAIG